MRVRTSVKLDAAVVTPQAKKKLDAAAAWAALQAAGYQPTRLVGPARHVRRPRARNEGAGQSGRGGGRRA